jgi:HTH-type transcriptional regulator/antitoxin HigA
MIHPVTDHESHAKALQRIEQLWDAAPGSPEADELDALATLVDAYERRAFPISPPDPVEAIEARREQLGWSRKQLEPLLGSRARVSEVLTRRRALTLPMIRRVHEAMGIPAELLITEPRPLAKARARGRAPTGKVSTSGRAGTRKSAGRSRTAAQRGRAAGGAARRG